ncbi:MAG: glycosyltransferase family 39 protein [Nanoarchaeota archaeon]|nr:glycosyltransferase family 39 protein [Nanoarchaeota archaeon]
MNKIFKDNLGLILIILSFLSLYLLYLNPNSDLWWDSSVYIGMGKYIYSFGEIGLYEDSRPLVWPMILGSFWKLGLDVIFFGKLMVLLFGIGVIILTYLVAYELFDKKIALISSFLLAFNPTFFFFNSIMFAGIPSIFFSLSGIYLFIRGKYSLAGFLLGIAFMTRFFQIFIALPVYLFFIYLVYKKRATLRKFFISILFFIIPVTPYLILNLILYNNPFYSFLLQAWMTKFTGWIFYQQFNFYFLNLIKDNALVLFSILGIIFIFKNEKFGKFIIPIVFLLAFIPYNFSQHKEMRFLLSILPFLYILASYGIVKFSSLFKKNKNILLLLILIIGIFQVTPKLRLNDYDDKLGPFYDFVQNNEIEDGIWISNPSFIANTELKSDELIYYPLYNTKKMIELQNKLEEAKYVLINTCDIMPCPPWEGSCNQEHDNFIDLLKEKFNIYLDEGVGRCNYYIFT